MFKLIKTASLLLIIVASNVLTVSIYLGQIPSSVAGEPTTCLPGDVNGDETIDVADPIALLAYLFQDGPEPVACASEPELTLDELGLVQSLAELIEIVDVEDPNNDTVTYRTVRFTDCNLQIVNGLGATNGSTDDPQSVAPEDTIVNGLGNLIIGYNETRVSGDNPVNDHSGSHNIVVGIRQNYIGYGGLLAGRENTTSGSYCSVLGGFQNTADGQSTTVSGGRENTALQRWSSVNGGRENTSDADYASISGGRYNEATGPWSAIAGGSNGVASGTRSSILGGQFNLASGYAATVAGGEENSAEGDRSIVSGGFERTATGEHDWVAGSRSEDN